MSKNLLIVESPAKAKTIEKYLGKDFTVRSCYGHIRDLQKEKMGIDVENNFTPSYIISEDKEKVVKELKSLTKKSDEVWLATDEDREGEAISWHLCEALNLDVINTKRIVFHEITKPAILKAIEKPRTVDMHLVNAQQARRVLDRLVGFQLSPLLQKKMNFQMVLSAGRVQSVAVKLIVERKKEIESFQSTTFFDVKFLFAEKNAQNELTSFTATRPHSKSQTEIEEFLNSCIDADYTVKNIEIKEGKRSPSAPFTTSTLQQEASTKLGYPVRRTMQIAQRLYENGYITYMRTDSINLSNDALNDITKTIETKFGKNYHTKRVFKNKNTNAQEAHEAIRPTNMSANTIAEADGKSLYELIWKRTIACQMADAIIEKTIVDITISKRQDTLKSEGEVIRFDGFLSVYNSQQYNKNEDEDENTAKILPPLTIGQKLNFKKAIAKQKFTKPIANYSEATLVKKLEELGIGRPSTYASTINTILTRNYVIKEDRPAKQRTIKIATLEDKKVSLHDEVESYGGEKNRLYASDLGIIVTDYLSEHFDQIMDYKFTANVEEDLDKIAEGKEEWGVVVENFYTPFSKLVEINKKDDSKINSEKKLGTDLKTGKDVIVRMARYGPVAQLGNQEDEDKPIFANLKHTQSLETITFEEALELLSIPKNLGSFENEPVIINIGRYGPYISHKERSYSLDKNMDPYNVDLSQSIEIISDKRRLPRIVGQFENKELSVNIGRFGPYVLFDDTFYSLKKDIDLYTISEEDLIPILKEQREKKEKNTLKEFPADKIKILKGKFGPYIKYGRMNIKMNKELKDNIDTLTPTQIKDYVNALTKTPEKKETKKVATKQTAKKKNNSYF